MWQCVRLDVSRALHDINSRDVFNTFFICSFHLISYTCYTCISLSNYLHLAQSQKRTPYLQSTVTIQLNYSNKIQCFFITRVIIASLLITWICCFLRSCSSSFCRSLSFFFSFLLFFSFFFFLSFLFFLPEGPGSGLSSVAASCVFKCYYSEKIH